MRELFTFKGRLGRLGRLAYLARLLMGFIVFVVPALLLATLSNQLPRFWLLLLLLAIALPFLAYFIWVSVRRLHDVNLRAWWLLLVVVPYVDLAMVAYMVLKKGSVTENKYGEPPTKRKWEQYAGLLAMVLVVYIFQFILPEQAPLYSSIKTLTHTLMHGHSDTH